MISLIKKTALIVIEKRLVLPVVGWRVGKMCKGAPPNNNEGNESEITFSDRQQLRKFVSCKYSWQVILRKFSQDEGN